VSGVRLIIQQEPGGPRIDVNKIMSQVRMWHSNYEISEKKLKWVLANIVAYCNEICDETDCSNCPLKGAGTGYPELAALALI